MTPPIPQITLEQFETEYHDRHLIYQAVNYWAARKPDEPAIIPPNRINELQQ